MCQFVYQSPNNCVSKISTSGRAEDGVQVVGGGGGMFPAGENKFASDLGALFRALTFMDMTIRRRALPRDQSFVRSCRSASHVPSRAVEASVSRARSHHASVHREARPATEREPLTRPVLKHRYRRRSPGCFRPCARDGRWASSSRRPMNWP